MLVSASLPPNPLQLLLQQPQCHRQAPGACCRGSCCGRQQIFVPGAAQQLSGWQAWRRGETQQYQQPGPREALLPLEGCNLWEALQTLLCWPGVHQHPLLAQPECRGCLATECLLKARPAAAAAGAERQQARRQQQTWPPQL